MPLSPSEASVINTSMQVSSQAGTNYQNKRLTREQNKIDRDREDYWNYKQREWAEADWQRAAQYNSPAQQMKRFKEAGLNPNLIYGKASEMPVIKTTSTSSTRGSAPRVENPLANVNVAQAYYSAQMMEKQIKLLDQEIVGKRIENAKDAIDSRQKANDYLTGVKTEGDLMGAGLRDRSLSAKYQKDIAESQREALDLEIATDLKDVKTDTEFQKLIKLQYENSTNEDQRAILKQKLELMKDQHIMNEFEKTLNAMGFTKGDEVYYRVLNTLYNEYFKK